MLISIPVLQQPLGQVLRKQLADVVEKDVRQILWQKRAFIKQVFCLCLESVGLWQSFRSKVLDRQRHILRVFFCDSKCRLIHVLDHLRKMYERTENVATHLHKVIRIIRSENEHLLLFWSRKRIHSHSKTGNLARAATRFVETCWVCVITIRHIGIEIADAIDIVDIGCNASIIDEICIRERAGFESGENLFGRLTKVANAEVIDQFKRALLIHSSIECKLGIGGTPLAECAASIIRHATNNSRTNTRRPQYRMRNTINLF